MIVQWKGMSVGLTRLETILWNGTSQQNMDLMCKWSEVSLYCCHHHSSDHHLCFSVPSFPLLGLDVASTFFYPLLYLLWCLAFSCLLPLPYSRSSLAYLLAFYRPFFTNCWPSLISNYLFLGDVYSAFRWAKY